MYIVDEERNGFINTYHPPENFPASNFQENIMIVNEQNNKKIKFMDYIYAILFILGMVNFVLFLVLAILKMDKSIEWSNFQVSLNFHFSALSFFFLSNILICDNSKFFQNCFGKFFLMITVNLMFILLMSFMFFLTLKMDGIINWGYSQIFIPIYVIIILTFLFLCFIMPGLVNPEVKMYKEAIVGTLHYISGVIIFTLVFLKLDGKTNSDYSIIFIIEEIILVIHFIMNYKYQNDMKLLYKIENFALILFFLISFVLVGIKLDDVFQERWIFVAIPVYCICILFIIKSVRAFSEVFMK